MTNHQAPNEANMMSHSIDKTSGLEPSLCFTHTLGGNLTHLTLRLEFFAFLQEQIGNRFVPDLEGWLEPVLLFLKPTNRLLNGARV